MMYLKNIDRMKSRYDKKVQHEAFQVGDNVSLRIPVKDRRTFDMRRLPCRIVSSAYVASGRPLFTVRYVTIN